MKQVIRVLLGLSLIFSICSFTCPKGKKLKDKGIPIKPNGCGPEVKSLITKVNNKLANLFGYQFRGCCNTHDICYSKCGTSKKNCDTNFLSCMRKICVKKNILTRAYCKLMAQSFYALVDQFGMRYFESAQRQQCICV